jgi:DNA-binding CsgD family transcriptional regulator
MEIHTMKRTADGEFYGGLDPTTGVRIVSEFQLDGDCYVLVEVCTAAGPSLPNDLSGGTGAGYCEILGKTYTVVKCGPTLETRQELADLLTERELEVATLVALGRPNKQIADKLHISEWTVSTHLRRIFAKLSVHSRAAMIYRCAALIGTGYGKELSNSPGWSRKCLLYMACLPINLFAQFITLCSA